MPESTPPWVVAVCVAVCKQGHVLAMRRSASKDAGPGLWETVSGRVEPGEHPAEAAVREVTEETGLAVRIDPRPVTAYPATRLQAPMMVIVYRADWEAGEVRMSDEHDAWAWLDADTFATRSSLPQLVGAVRTALGIAGERSRS